VVFSLVFLLLLSFVLSFFEMAARAARASYHASAALLAVENYFAGYLDPLFSEYHIFGNEVTDGVGLVASAQSTIGSDVAYMTKKEENQKSLLLRSGADFSVVSADVLTANKGEGFYAQATTAMKYRGIVEIKELIQQFVGATEQTDTHMKIAAAKASADEAYAVVEGELLTLIEQVDGVILSKYEQYLRGATTVFQANRYVKYFCADKENAAQYFDRAEVYQAFLESSTNQEEVIDRLIEDTEKLIPIIREREIEESTYQARAASISEERSAIETRLDELLEWQENGVRESEEIQQKIDSLMQNKEPDTEQIAELSGRLDEILANMETWNVQKQELVERDKLLKEESREIDGCLSELEEERLRQEEMLYTLICREDLLLDKCESVAEKCSEAKQTLEEIQKAMKLAEKAKENCRNVIDAASKILGESQVKSYRESLDAYRVYGSADGYDFVLMGKTLTSNQKILESMSSCFTEMSASALAETVEKLKTEKKLLQGYSFEGLKLDYGEMTLETSPYEGLETKIATKMSKGFLSFVIADKLSAKILEKTYLPSGFRYGGRKDISILSILELGADNVFEEIQSMLPKASSLSSMAEAVTDSVLFHSYLVTHFSNYLEENENGALSYEIEYLIGGKMADVINLSEVAMRICVIRAALQFISLYGDSVRRMQAEQIALAACGIIGFPALVSVVTTAILLVWAIEEAVIDTAALLQGKKLLLYPGTAGGSLAVSELLLFTKNKIQERAKAKESVPGALFGYKEYLQIFLLLEGKEEKCYRAMDLVQENLRLCYNKSFRLKNCIWRISYQVDGRNYSYAYDW